MPEGTEGVESVEQGEGTVYYVLDDGGAVARLLDGWERQVWRPSLRAWEEADIDFGVEGREITEEEAEGMGADLGGATDDFGEFGPDQEDGDE